MTLYKIAVVSSAHGDLAVVNQVKDIVRLRTELADAVRKYSSSQTGLWRTIPWLAIEAQGHGGWSDSYYVALYGLWRVNSGKGCYTVHVDCNDGRLLYGLRPATDEELIRISANLEALNASKIADYLLQQIKMQYTGNGVPKKHDADKNSQRRAYGVKRVYFRSRPLPEKWEDLHDYQAA